MAEPTKEDIIAIRHFEHQILALEKEWLKYEKLSFVDWNKKFGGMIPEEIKMLMKTPKKDMKYEKKEFGDIWKRTIHLFKECANFLRRGMRQKAIEHLLKNLNLLEKELKDLEAVETETITFLTQNQMFFQQIFNSIYSQDYFKTEVIENFELRFRILQILLNEYEFIKEAIIKNYDLGSNNFNGVT